MDIDYLIAKQRISELSATYMHGLDRLDAGALRSVFHDDAETDYGFYKGKVEGFVEMAMGALREHQSNHHLLGQINIWLNHDVAIGEVYFHAFHRIPGRKTEGDVDLVVAGRYVDRYERRDEVWKIAFRSEINDWSKTSPAADSFFLENPAALRGARAPHDPISQMLAQLKPANQGE